jgi:tripartite-type tricarboxylate transporter receptor subunit TctC
LIVPFAAGGVVDQVARFLAAYAQDKWKVAITVDDKAGGGGFIGTVAGLQAPPDGYTLYLDGPSTFYGLAGTKNPPFKIEDGTAINRITINPVAFTVKGDSKWNTLKDVVDDVKKAPENYKMASAGAAGLATMAGAKLWMQAGIDPAKVAIMVFDGGAPANTAVAGGSADFCSQNLAEAISLYQAKKLKILAVTTPQRFGQVPEVPTGKEAGFDQYNTVGFVDLWGPSKLPDNIVAAWDALVSQALKDPKFLDQLDKAGFLPGYQSPKEHRDFINGEYKFAAEIVAKLGIAQ